MINTLFPLAGALFLLYVAVLLWQKAQQQPVVMPVDTHTRSGYIPPVAPPQPPAATHFDSEDDDDDGDISPETLAAWAAAEQSDQRAAVIKPSWGATLYESLGIRPDATPEEIRTAYREQCNIWHPDRNDDPDASDEFAVVANAYKILTTQRQQYDAGLALESQLN